MTTKEKCELLAIYLSEPYATKNNFALPKGWKPSNLHSGSYKKVFLQNDQFIYFTYDEDYHNRSSYNECSEVIPEKYYEEIWGYKLNELRRDAEKQFMTEYLANVGKEGICKMLKEIYW